MLPVAETKLLEELNQHGIQLYGTEKTIHDPIRHRAFNSWKVLRDHRFPFLIPFLPPAPGVAIDVGSQLGYWASRLVQQGFFVTAIEHDQTHINWCRQLMFMQNLFFDVWEGDCVEFFEQKAGSVVGVGAGVGRAGDKGAGGVEPNVDALPPPAKPKQVDVITIIGLIHHLFQRDTEGARHFLRLLFRAGKRVFIDDDPVHLPGHVLMREVFDACAPIFPQIRMVFNSHDDGKKIYCIDTTSATISLPWWTECLDIVPSWTVTETTVDSIHGVFCPGQTIVDFLDRPSYVSYYPDFYQAVKEDFDPNGEKTKKWLTYYDRAGLNPKWTPEGRRVYFYDLLKVMELGKEKGVWLVAPVQCSLSITDHVTEKYVFEGVHRIAIAHALGIGKVNMILTDKKLT